MVRPERDRIGAEWPVEIDEVFIGGATKGEGRGVHHKVIVVGAVEIRHGKQARGREHNMALPKKGKTYAGRLRLHIVPNRGQRALEEFVLDNIESGARVTTDGWEGYANLEELGYRHKRLVAEIDVDDPEALLPMVHIIFSNLKAWLLGIHHGVSQQHLQAYLNEFTFRFNRRFYPFTAFNSLLGIGVRVEAPTYDELYSGDWVHPNPGTED
jgi:transposase-like protein